MNSFRHNALAILLIAIGCLRIVSTYGTFNETFDEPAHIAAGMEILQFHSYTYEMQHPPLGRLFLAIGPYLEGARAPVHRDTMREGLNIIYPDGSSILYQQGDRWRNLSLARMGVLPFFILLCWITYRWAGELFSPRGGLWAAALVSSTPVVLGHSGFATLDVAGAAGALCAFYAFSRWLDEATVRRSLWLGAAIALALLTKMSSVVFLPIGFGITAAWAVLRRGWRPKVAHVAIALGTAFLLEWAGYGFSLKKLGPQWGPHPTVDRKLEEHPALRPVWEVATNTPLPLTELILGVRDTARHNGIGHDGYLLGQFSRTGWWYFFPVVMAVKTPLGLLFLSIAGLVWAIKDLSSRAVPAIIVVALLAFLTSARINSGARHVLVLYPLMAILAAGVIKAVPRKWAAIPMLLAAWTIFEGARAHPDYQGYFNQVAGSRPERILAESDLDWGQDLDRLARRLRELRAPSVAIRYFGSALLEKAGLPEYRALDPQQPTTGWIAISAHHLYIDRAKDGSYGWLLSYTPRERIGKSIDLFYIPE